MRLRRGVVPQCDQPEAGPGALGIDQGQHEPLLVGMLEGEGGGEAGFCLLTIDRIAGGSVLRRRTLRGTAGAISCLTLIVAFLSQPLSPVDQTP